MIWEQRLTPFDRELAMMVESLTEKECVLKNGGDCYFFEADYEKHNDPQYILAMWDAIEGRLGERLKEIKDDPDRHVLLIWVNFSEEKYPKTYGDERDVFEANPRCGALYCNPYEELRAVLVEEENADTLRKFVGGGSLHVAEDGTVVFRFLNGSVFCDVKEGDFVCYQNGRYFVMTGEELCDFENKRVNNGHE